MPAETQAGKPRIDLSRYELSLDGERVKLERQPMDLLILLAQRRGQLVSREEIVEKLWGKDVFVDVDRSINAAIRKIRSALKDDSTNPKYLETIIGKGYRFTGELEVVDPTLPVETTTLDRTKPQSQQSRPHRGAFFLWLTIVLAAAVLFFVGLRWHPGSSSDAHIHSIAVLPLANLSDDASQNYFADGMTEELTTELGKISALKVISRTSAQKYRGSNLSAPQIARELKVDALVEGSVLRSGNRVRITTQLIDALNDRHLWAETYDRDLSDALGVQSTVALEIARQVRARLTSAEQQILTRHVPLNADAYDAYLRGRYSQTTQSAEKLKEGLPAFQEAISLDPTYAPAYAGLADTYSLLANYNVLAPNEAFPLAEAAARKAVELDPASAEAHTALAFPLHHYAWKWADAEREYKTAISLNPSYSTAHLRYAEFLSSVGRHDEAISEMHRALDLDPLSLTYLNNLGRFLYHARRYDEAIDLLRQALALDPSQGWARLHLAMCYEEKGRNAQAMQEYERTRSVFGGPSAGMARHYAKIGQPARAREIANRLRREASDSNWFFIAGIYAALGDKDEALACLQTAYTKRDFFLVFIKVHPFMDPLRTDSRFQNLVHRLGVPE